MCKICHDTKPAGRSMDHDHTAYVRAVADIALSRLDEEDRKRCSAALVYGAGRAGLLGVTYYSKWQNGEESPVPLVEICAFGEESDVQLAHTVLHELGHVYAGHAAGHGADWKRACERLGLRGATQYYRGACLAQFAPDIRHAIAALPSPVDGRPVGAHRGPGRVGGPTGDGPPIGRRRKGGCPAGIGTRGGTSRGKGSGSRMRKYVCDCGQIIRAATDELRAHCDKCEGAFKLA